jgi:prepilin-type N-terminal cleavage/methylation domain-containing protein
VAKRSEKQGVARATTAAFTLIEVLVTVLLVAIVLVGVMGGIRALGAADAKARDADLLQRLAARKWEELGTVDDPATAEDRGDFDDAGHPEIEWTLTVEPSAVENVDTVTVTARHTSSGAEQSLTGMVFVRPVAGGATGDGNTGNTGGATTP